jgi:hypothetical protein
MVRNGATTIKLGIEEGAGGGEEFVTYNLKEVRGGNERDQKTIRSVVTLN